MMGLEEDIANILSNEIAKDIDFGILSEMLVAAGWTKYSLPRYIDSKHEIDIQMWAEQHMPRADYRQHGSTWLFSNANDATMFILKWAK
jgi:hypothetical protein